MKDRSQITSGINFTRRQGRIGVAVYENFSREITRTCVHVCVSPRTLTKNYYDLTQQLINKEGRRFQGAF